MKKDKKVHSERTLNSVIFIKENDRNANDASDDKMDNTNYSEQSIENIVNDIVKNVEDKFDQINLLNEEEEKIKEEPVIRDGKVLEQWDFTAIKYLK